MSFYLEKLKSALNKEPQYRLKQAWQSIFKDLISDWGENSTLPLYLREKLNKECPLTINADLSASKDNQTLKALITLEDGLKIETVLLFHKDKRKTICLSSQAGCPLNCAFCATGRAGFKRNLTVDEIISQLLFFSRYLYHSDLQEKKINNIVFMGMGEPFLNYDNVIEAIRIINDKDGFNIGARSISISTCGIIPGINKLAKEKLQINLAISLHAPNDKLRSRMMPINKKYPLKKLMSSVESYVKKKSRQIMFEYLMIDGLNDGEEQAKELAKLLKHPLYVLNLIRYNPTGTYKPSSFKIINKFKNILLRSGVKVTQRYSFGADIGAACGQLAGKFF